MKSLSEVDFKYLEKVISDLMKALCEVLDTNGVDAHIMDSTDVLCTKALDAGENLIEELNPPPKIGC